MWPRLACCKRRRRCRCCRRQRRAATAEQQQHHISHHPADTVPADDQPPLSSTTPSAPREPRPQRGVVRASCTRGTEWGPDPRSSSTTGLTICRTPPAQVSRMCPTPECVLARAMPWTLEPPLPEPSRPAGPGGVPPFVFLRGPARPPCWPRRGAKGGTTSDPSPFDCHLQQTPLGQGAALSLTDDEVIEHPHV